MCEWQLFVNRVDVFELKKKSQSFWLNIEIYIL